MTTEFGITDHVGAWVPHGRFTIAGAASGPLAGLRFAAKDLFDVAGHATGAGNPAWLATHAPAQVTNPIIDSLLTAGATLVGKTLTDELAYSIQGDNMHYGTPLNTRAPERIPGGSSSGSVAAVAAGLCDFALGTDTGGSTRVPASYCGVWGLRTTHGLLPHTAMVPLSPDFDTPTWMAHDADTFVRVAEVLLPPAPASTFSRAFLLNDALAQADEVFRPNVERVFAALKLSCTGTRCTLTTTGDELEHWRRTYVTASAYQAWQVHRAWIEQHSPEFAPAIAARWEMARKIIPDAAHAAQRLQAAIRARVRTLLGNNGVAVLPSACSVAPRLNASDAEIDLIRNRNFRITCIAGLTGLPQVSLPFIAPTGLPIGISLLGPAGSDLLLIKLAVAIWRQLH